MFYLFFGTDADSIREKARTLFESLRLKKPDASFGELSAEEVTKEKIDELVGGMGLFENKCVVLAHNIFSDTESREIAGEFIKELGDSPNIFILAETGLTKALSGKLEKKSEKTQELSLKDKEKKERPETLFYLADALGGRDSTALWTGLVRAIENGAVPEEIHGIFFWQVKSMIVASITKNAEDAGLNPYVFNKSKSFARNFKKEELKNLSNRLVSIYHEAHRGRTNFNIALEKFALDL